VRLRAPDALRQPLDEIAQADGRHE
jgi:hypothetical protein